MGISRFRKVGLAAMPLLASGILASCGGGGGGSDGPAASAGPQAVDVEISGKALAGSALSGVVNVYRLTEDGERGEAYTDEVNTTENKDYALSFTGVEGEAVLVELVSDDTPVVCGLPVCERDTQGAPIVQFGDSHKPTISLSGIVVLRQSPTPSTTAAVTRAEGDELNLTVNLTALTQLAADLIAAKANANSTVVLKDLAVASNAQVANRFGISDLNLLDAPLIDLTDPDAVNGAAKIAVENSLKIAGVLGSAVSQGKGNTIGSALSGISSDYVTQGIADKEDQDSGAVTLEEILETALALLGNVKTQTGVNGQSQTLQDAQVTIANEEADKQQNGSTASTQGNVPADIGEQGLVATKGMVKQLRDLAAAADVFTPSANQTAFSDEIEAAELLLNGDIDAVGVALELALGVLNDAFETNQEAQQSSYSDQGITVTITNSGNNETYVVEQDVDVMGTVVAVAITAAKTGTLEQSESANTDGNVYTESFNGAGDGELAVTGSAGTDAVGVELKDGSKIQFKFSYNSGSTETTSSAGGVNSYDDEWNDRFTVDSASMVLDVAIAQKTASPVAFEGVWSASLTGFDTTDSGTYQESFGNGNYSGSEDGTEVIGFSGASTSLTGTLSAPSGSFDASLSFSVGAYSETCSYGFSYDSTDPFNSEPYDDDCVDTDTNSDFAAVNLNMILHLDVEGVSDDMRVEFNADRNGLEDGKVDLEFSYEDGKLLSAAYNSREANRTVVLSNHNGVEMTGIFLETVSGTIKQSGTKFADMDEDAGFLIITYTDGTFESVAL